MMATSQFFLLCICVLFAVTKGSSQGKVWNPATDPIPPLQPKEVGMQLYNAGSYYIAESGAILSNLQISGYQFESYANQVVVALANGQNVSSPPVPFMQYSWNNFTSGANLLAEYTSQTCTTGEVEGGAPYPGYDFYTEYIFSLYYSNITVYYQNITRPGYGSCLQYSAYAPWDNPALPRNLIYTLVYQESTGYMIEYSLNGTEYCCLNGDCPNSGNCADGSVPLLTVANTNQTMFGYQIFTEDSWPAGFFDPYCPFDQTNSDSNSNNDHHFKMGEAFALLFGLLFFGAAAVSVVMLFSYQDIVIKYKKMEQELSAMKSNA